MTDNTHSAAESGADVTHSVGLAASRVRGMPRTLTGMPVRRMRRTLAANYRR